MSVLRLLLSLLFITVVCCCSSKQTEVEFQRSYGRWPEEEGVAVYKYPNSGNILMRMTSTTGFSQVGTLCCNLDEEYRIILTDSANDGWSTGSYLTVSYKDGIIFNRASLASGGYVELTFTVLSSEMTWVYFVIGLVAIIIVIVIIVQCCKSCCC